MFKYLYQTHYFVMLVYIVCMFVQDSDIEKKKSATNSCDFGLFTRSSQALSRDFQCAWQNAHLNTVRRAMMCDVYYKP